MWDVRAQSSVRNCVGESFAFKDRLVVGWRTKTWQRDGCCLSVTDTIDMGLLLVESLIT